MLQSRLSWAHPTLYVFLNSFLRALRPMTAVAHNNHSRLSPGLLLLVLIGLIAAPASAGGQTTGSRYINPPGLVTPTGYTHIVVAPDGRTVYIAGQVAFDSLGRVVGAGDLRKQLEQVYSNLRTALTSVGGTLSDLVKTTTYITDMSQVAAVREVRSRFLDPNHPPANTLLGVAALARPELLVEIEAVAIVGSPVP